MQDSASAAWCYAAAQLPFLERIELPTRWGRNLGMTLHQGPVSLCAACLQSKQCRSSRQPLSMVLDFKCCSQLAVIRLIELCPAVRPVRGKLTFGKPRRLTPTEWSSGRASRTILQVMPRICKPRPRICADQTMPRLPGQTMRVRCLFNGPPSFGQARLGFQCHGLMDRTLDSASIRMSVCLCWASRLWYEGLLPRKLVCCLDIYSSIILVSVHLPPHDCMRGTGCLYPFKDGGHWNAPADISIATLQALPSHCAMKLSLWSGKSMLCRIPCCCYKVLSLPGPKSGGDTICCWRCNSHVGLPNKIHWCSAESVADVRVEERAGLSSEAVVKFVVWFPNAKPTGRGATEPARPTMRYPSCGRSLTHSFFNCKHVF